MVVGAPRHDPVAARLQRARQRRGVVPHLLHVLTERRLQRLEERHRLGRDDVDEGTALHPREHDAVERLALALLAQDQSAAGTSKRLVGRGGHEVAVRHRARMQAGGDQPGDVGDVRHHLGVHRARDGADALEIDDPGVCRGAAHDQLRAMLGGEPFQCVVVDPLVLPGDAVAHEAIQHAGHVQGVPVRQMAAVGQVHPEHGVARLQHREVHRLIGLATGVCLHVGMLRAEQLLGASDGQPLDDVGVLAAPVVPPARVAFRIFVGEDGSHRLQHRLADEVLGSDQLEPVRLPLDLVLHRVGDFGVHLTKGPVHHCFTPRHPVSILEPVGRRRGPPV